MLNGLYDDQLDEYLIIDSRYPYEYEGGHIRNAVNIYEHNALYEEMFINRLNLCSRLTGSGVSFNSFRSLSAKKNSHHQNHHTRPQHHSVSSSSLKNDKDSTNTTTQTNGKKRTIIIFHCEFSHERGPRMLKFLRKQDRSLNDNIYPKLFYPELYLLKGGYKSFYEKHKVYKHSSMNQGKILKKIF